MRKILIIFLLFIFNSNPSLSENNEKFTVEDIEDIFFARYEKQYENESLNEYLIRVREFPKTKTSKWKIRKRERILQSEKQRNDETIEQFYKRIEAQNKVIFDKRNQFRGTAKCLYGSDSSFDSFDKCVAKIIRSVFLRKKKYQKKRPGDLFYAIDALGLYVYDYDRRKPYYKYFYYNHLLGMTDSKGRKLKFDEKGDEAIPGMRCEKSRYQVGYNCVGFKKSTLKKIEKFKIDPSNEKVLGHKLIKFIKNIKMVLTINDKIGTKNYALLGDMLNLVVVDVKKNNLSKDLIVRRSLLEKYALLLNKIKRNLDKEKYKSVQKDALKLSEVFNKLNGLPKNSDKLIINIDNAVEIIFSTNELVQKSIIKSQDNREDQLLAYSSIYFLNSLIESILNAVPDKYYAVTKDLPVGLFSKSELVELDEIINHMIKKNKATKSLELKNSMEDISKYIDPFAQVKKLEELGMKNSISRDFTETSAAQIAEENIIASLNRGVIKEAKKILEDNNNNDLSQLTKEISRVANEISSDPSVKSTVPIRAVDRKYGGQSLKKLIGAGIININR